MYKTILLFKIINHKNNNIMTDIEYQILCRNIEACAESILDSYKALNNPTSSNINTALISSVIKLTDYCPELSKQGSLNILLNGEELLKQISDYYTDKH